MFVVVVVVVAVAVVVEVGNCTMTKQLANHQNLSGKLLTVFSASNYCGLSGRLLCTKVVVVAVVVVVVVVVVAVVVGGVVVSVIVTATTVVLAEVFAVDYFQLV